MNIATRFGLLYVDQAGDQQKSSNQAASGANAQSLHVSVSSSDSATGSDAGTIQFPIKGILDAFNRANEGPPPSSSWVQWVSSGLKVDTNQCAPVDNADNGAYIIPAIFGTSVEAYVTIAVLPATGGETVVACRLDPAANTGYSVMHIVGSPGTIRIRRHTGPTTWVDIGGPWNTTLAAGDSIGIRCIDDQIEAWAKISGVWSRLGKVTDANIVGASPNDKLGLFNYGASVSAVARYDNFGGGSLSTEVDIPAGDVAVGTDSATVRVRVASNQAATGAQTATAGIFKSSTDSGTFTDNAAPIRPVLDNANRANEGPPPTGWTAWGSVGIIVDTNQFAPSDSGDNGAYWTTAMTSSDVEAYVTIATLPPTAGETLVVARLDPATGNYYGIQHTVGSPDTIRLQRYDASTPTQLASWSLDLSAGDRIGIRCQGSRIEAWVSIGAVWKLMGAVTDATYNGLGNNNKLGLYSFGNGVSTVARYDDFGGGALGVPATFINVSDSMRVPGRFGTDRFGTFPFGAPGENAVVSQGAASTDLAHGTDSHRLARRVSDSISGNDSQALKARITQQQTATGTDSATGATSARSISVSDSMHGTDSSQRAFLSKDTITGTDVGVSSIQIVSSDVMQGTETAKPSRRVTDSATGTDAFKSLKVRVSSVQQASGTDTSGIDKPQVTQTGVFTETQTLKVRVASVQVATGLDLGEGFITSAGNVPGAVAIINVVAGQNKHNVVSSEKKHDIRYTEQEQNVVISS